MTSIAVRPKRSASHIDDGDMVLESGRTTFSTVLLSSIAGGSWTRQKLERLSNAMQKEIDDQYRQRITSYPADDPFSIHGLAGDDAWFLANHGGKVFIDGDSIVIRHDTITFALVDGDLMPTVTVVK